MSSTIESILQILCMAPSGHNTQPWKFEVKDNMVIAADHFDYDSVIKINTEREGEESIEVTLLLAAPKSESHIFDCIDISQVNRNTYTGDPIPATDLEQLQITALQKNVESIILTHKENIEPVIKLVKEGSIRQFSNPSFIIELVHWIRFLYRS